MMIVLLLGIAAVTLLWNWYYRQNWYRHVMVTLWFETQALYAGETTKLFEVIENRIPSFFLKKTFIRISVS